MTNKAYDNSALDGNSVFLMRFALTASLARTTTGASIVAVLVLAAESELSGMVLGGLAACLTAPHLIGPVWGRWLDSANDPRRLIAIAGIVYSSALVLVSLLFPMLSTYLIAALLIICGGCAPFLMGGISGLLNQAFQGQPNVRRKAQGWDVACYAIGTTIGPILFGILTTLVNAQSALASIALLPLISSILVTSFPSSESDESSGKGSATIFDVAKTIATNPALCRTLYLTSATSFSLAALPVCSIFLAHTWSETPAAAANLVSSYGVGNLLGSLFLIRKPSQKAADSLMSLNALAVIAGIAFVSVSNSYAAGLIAYLVCGIANAFFFASTLAARTEYAPPESASQVFMWIAAIKIGAVSLGSFVAGWLSEKSLTLTLMLSLTILLVSTLLSVFHRHLKT
ncbi:MFS transporter [Vibrio sonorensis]|uniref:MFS transporter n=1 Tax=Vibrio sonorensis TaxID=1004316 RepID=UPI0009FE450F|nr:MFS transporter [Vibrio sonorensis]